MVTSKHPDKNLNAPAIIYADINSLRQSGNYGLLPQPDLEHQYFPVDMPPWKTPLRFIDCGAFNGDTLDQLMKTGLAVSAVAAFEPDLANFHELSRFASSNAPALGEVGLWPCGVHSSTTQMRFAMGRNASSGFSDSGDQVITCVALDDVLPCFQPSLIKMDIEGAEYDALLGASVMIHTYRPGLAICIYHAPDHIWQIPLLVKQWDLGYRLYLRLHRYNAFDLVMYAIPTE